MSKLREMYHQLRRIAILRFLFIAPGKTVNSDILKIVLNERGITTTADDLTSDLYFLKDAGFVDVRYFFEEKNLAVYTLTERGEDVATGRLIAQGVRRPRKGDNLPEIPEDELGVPYGSN